MRTQLENFGYFTAQTITFQNLLHNAKERKITSFWWAWEGLIDFTLLRNLRFIEGIIHEDHHFGALLFAQSKQICILPQKLYQHRIRKGSTMTKWSASEIPSYLKPLCAHFSYDMAREYFRIYSLTITTKRLYEFSNSGVDEDLRDDFRAFTMTYLLEFIIKVYEYPKDPYHLRAQIAELLKSMGKNSLSKKVKRYFVFYASPKLCKYIWVLRIFKSFYESLKNLERKFRHWRRGVLGKANK